MKCRSTAANRAIPARLDMLQVTSKKGNVSTREAPCTRHHSLGPKNGVSGSRRARGASSLLAAYFLSNTFLVFGSTQCVREQAVQVTGS